MNKNTTPITKQVLFDPSLKDSSKLVYCYLTKCIVLNYKTNQYFKLNASKISKKLHLDVRTVRSSITELEERNLFNSETNEIYYINEMSAPTLLDETVFQHQNYVNSKSPCEEIGGYVEAPKDILYNEELSAGEKITWLSLKGCAINKGSFQLHWNWVSKITNTPLKTLKRNIKSLKEKGYIDYFVKRNGSKITETQIENLKLIESPKVKIDETKLEATTDAVEELEELIKPVESPKLAAQKALTDCDDILTFLNNEPSRHIMTHDEEVDALLAFV